MKNKLRGSLYLLIGTVIWGSAFIAQSVGMDHIGPFTFQTVRCGLAVVFLVAVTVLVEIKGLRPGKYIDKWMQPRLWKTGVICGTALFVAAGLQQAGLVYTTAGKAGFITAMYIVLVPVLGLFLGRKPVGTVWFGVVLAVSGLYLLCRAGVSRINTGDLLMLGSAMAFAVQITLIDRLAEGLDGLRLNCIQSLVCALLSGVVMAATETVDLANIASCWLPLGYAGILSMGVAYTLQILGQRELEPTSASLIMSLESVFAALFGWLLLKETMAPREILGCLLVFAAVILSQLPNRQKQHD